MPTFNERGYPAIRSFFDALPFLPLARYSVFKHFISYAGLPKGIDRVRSLWNGIEPEVRILHIPGHYGYTPPSRREIWIDKTFADDYEALANFTPTIFDYYTINAKAYLLLEVTVLHEMIHYFRRRFGHATWDQRAEERIARQFEKDAYGMYPTAASLHIDHLIHITPK